MIIINTMKPQKNIHFHYLFHILFAFTLISFIGCTNSYEQNNLNKEKMKPIIEVINTYSAEIMNIPGVVGLYEGILEDGSPCITVMVKKITPNLNEQIPDNLDGYSVLIEETGVIKPL